MNSTNETQAATPATTEPTAGQLAGHAAGPSAGHSAGTGQRVSTILADRVCTKCLFNLAGQPVYRERHYGMLIAVCPECGTAASIQEYPHLGKWSRRAIMVLAAGWFVILLAALLASGLITYAVGRGMVNVISEPMALRMAEAQHEYFKAQAELAGPPTQTASWYLNQTPTAYTPIDPTFLSGADIGAIRAESALGGQLLRARWIVRFAMVAVLGAFIGVFWAVVLPHARFWRRVLLVPGFAIVAALMAWFATPPDPRTTAAGWGWNYAHMVAIAELYWPWAYVLAWSALPFVVLGMLIGRGLGRWGVRMLLPPRLREPLYFLWWCDGLEPPGSAAHRR
ncbi:MAG: hypothetical protein KF768_06330 [Phycisphaeraceae bacterium]|nr:hypothetical protein [Phycisphaeraceae bacterium]